MDWKGPLGNWDVKFGKISSSPFLLTEGKHLSARCGGLVRNLSSYLNDTCYCHTNRVEPYFSQYQVDRSLS